MWIIKTSPSILFATLILSFATTGWADETISDSEAGTTAVPSNKLSGESIEFRRHVLPILSKLGCNSGACHGALAGKGGFKLSLNGYDPTGDHFNITSQSKGRRVELADPGRSLVLTKPTGALAHKGGLRLDPDSEDYRVLSEWIANGATGPTNADAILETLVVSPAQVSLKVGESKQLSVQAVYSDGRTEDVTKWAKFTSTLAPVVTADESGKVEVVGHGEGSIVVWFSSRLAVSTITSPFELDLADSVYDTAPKRNFIDQLVLDKLKTVRLAPSERCDDSTFVRRVFLDTIGMLPTAAEAQSFLADKSKDKRDALIDRLLTREEFVDYWAYRWSDVLLINGKRLRPQAVKAYYQWIRGHIKANTPWDEIVREVVTAQGSSYENGATNFYALHQSPEDMAENVSQAFMGLSIGCAKCHNHPLEKWTNDQYYAMANMFSRVRAKGWGGDARNGDGLRTVFLAGSGELDQPLTGKPQPPTPLDGVPLEFDDPSDRRKHLATWLTDADNPYFSRSVVNRVWANFMGRGLVENVDDMRVSNPATNEPLLAALGKYVVDNKYDLKVLMRLILQSETYQRSSVANAGNQADDRFYSRFYPRRLMAEVLLDAVSQVSEVPTEFKKIAHDGADIKDTKEYPIGTRAIELYDSAVFSSFLSKFGRNKRDIVCECERSNKPSMIQVLHIANGVTINEKLQSDSSCVGRLFVSKQKAGTDSKKPGNDEQKTKGEAEQAKANESQPNDQSQPTEPATELTAIDVPLVIRSAFLATLSREPSSAELQKLRAEFKDVAPVDLRESLEDLYWGLMSSREFLFQH